ncbi:MAG: class I SAM-dependent methyltransferase [Tepidiformaceae bacterium]
MDALRPDSATALTAWAARVRANRDQAERVREGAEGRDFYAPIASAFRADPDRTDEPALEILRTTARPGETWLDIGAGGGRYALPLARVVGEVIALDPSEGMLAILREGMSDHGITNVRPVHDRWPSTEPPALSADVCLISHVGYDIEEIGPFLDAMEAAARRLCVAVLLAQAPASAAAPYWPLVHGEPRALLPALPEFLSLLLARGRLFEVRFGGERRPIAFASAEEALTSFLRMQLFIAPGGEKDEKLRSLLAARAAADGTIPPAGAALLIGVVTWAPP